MSPPPRVAPLLFFSGCCALVYQIAWLREFRLVFGASTAASAAVLAIFVGGLGAGALLLGARADRQPRPMLFYARLEAAIALSAAVTPGLLWLVRQAYIALGGTLSLGHVGGALLRLLLSAVVLALPTWLMGGTLPAAARAVASSGDAGRSSVALLYGFNTLGAVTGSFVATFLMLEVFGTRATLWLACLVNLLVATAARQMAQTLPEPAGSDATEASAPAAPVWLVLTASAGVGLAFFLMELVWYRMLGPVLGGTVFTFGLILSVALLGIGVGGTAYSVLSRGRPATLLAFAWTCLVEAVALAVPYALGDRIAVLAHTLRPLGEMWLFWGHVLVWTSLCAIVVLPAAVVAGYQFPMLIALLGRGREGLGRHIGLAYLWNTLGAIAGSLAGGFGLLPLLSAPGAWRAAVWMLTGLGCLALFHAARAARQSRRALLPALVAAGAVALCFAPGPTAAWRHSGIGVGRAGDIPRSAAALKDWLQYHRRSVQWEADGVESSVAVVDHGPGFSFVINGKDDGNARADASTMLMSGLVGGLLHPAPRRSLVIGLGAGATAGWLAAIPSMERTDVVELEPLVRRVAAAASAVNADAMSNPRLHVFIGDAREILLVSRERYDLIVSEPSNPYRAGIASLFTSEYYAAVSRRLADGGLFLQWVQAYEIDSATLQSIYATLAGVFPVVETWQVDAGDLLLVGSRRALVHDAARLRARVAEEPFRSAVRAVWRVLDLEGVLSFHVARPEFARLVAERSGHLKNTDDRNSVEFGFARTVGRQGLFPIPELRSAAEQLGMDRPEVSGSVDWESVVDERIAAFSFEAKTPQPGRTATPSRRALATALSQYASGQLEGAFVAWRQVGRPPRNVTELALLAEGMAENGSADPGPAIDQLRALQPVEADVILSRASLRAGDAARAAEALAAAFQRYRTDPWALPSLMRRALPLALEIARRDSAQSDRLLDAVSAPFAVNAWEDERRGARDALATLTGRKGACREAVKAFEPHVPWTGKWLAHRLDCYTETADPGAGQAASDLREFAETQPMRLSARLGLVEP